MVAIDEPGGKLNLVKNISAQHKVLKRSIITETLIKTEIYLTDVSSLVLRHLQSEEYIHIFQTSVYILHSEDVARLAKKRQLNIFLFLLKSPLLWVFLKLYAGH